MNVLLWHVHGSWTTAFVQGPHRYVLPVLDDRGPDGRGRARTWDWPATTVERSPAELADEPIDVVLLQRPEDEALATEWLRRRPGVDVAAVYLEHNAPQGRIAELRHVAADRTDLVLVHVSHFNALFWDAGTTEVRVVEHGIVDPGLREIGELDAAAVVVNEPMRRGRVVGTDLLARFARSIPLDVFGSATTPTEDLSGAIAAFEGVDQAELHDELGRRRLYLHPVRWTSLGLSLIEAMHVGLPVVALGTTEVPDAVPAGAGVVSNRIEVLEGAIRRYRNDLDEARAAGRCARVAARHRFGLDRFLADWDVLLEEVAR
jgi:glycosyltransferase involved in cell wall biosynthesis